MKLLHVVSPALGLASHESESPCGTVRRSAFAYRRTAAVSRTVRSFVPGAGRLAVTCPRNAKAVDLFIYFSTLEKHRSCITRIRKTLANKAPSLFNRPYTSCCARAARRDPLLERSPLPLRLETVSGPRGCRASSTCRKRSTNHPGVACGVPCYARLRGGR